MRQHKKYKNTAAPPWIYWCLGEVIVLCAPEGYTERAEEFVAHGESITIFLSHQAFDSFLLYYTKEVLVSNLMKTIVEPSFS